MIQIFYLILDFNKETHSEFLQFSQLGQLAFLFNCQLLKMSLMSGNFFTVWPSQSPLPSQLSSYCVALPVTPPFTTQFFVSATDIQFWFSKAIRGVATNLSPLSPSCRSLERAGVGRGGEDIKKIWIVHHFQGNYLNKFFRNAYSQETRIV